MNGKIRIDFDIQGDETAKPKLKECSFIDFWLSKDSTYPILTRNPIPLLLVFPSTRECEKRFSVLMTIKSKTWNRLNEPGHDFQCAVSKVVSRTDLVMEKKHLHVSHQTVFSVIH